eukprot:Tbor_TRINITY_DN5764_c8_g4::TRINITY_DN5764_c8_g4_i1::g.20283::m.20283/K03011/RPB3, POLR2C; DNA-directed RNA polymerase II subunit RPB3
MEIEILGHIKPAKSSGEELRVSAKNVDNSFVNAIRRVMLSEIPSMAIDVCTVISNTSVFFDEMIVHRLGLIPVKVTVKQDPSNPYEQEGLQEFDPMSLFSFHRECECKKETSAGCARCQIGGRITVRCPSNLHKREVYASDMVFDCGREDTPHPNIILEPVSSEENGVLLLTLGRCQEIDIQFFIRKGIAKEHAKWMTVATVVMKYKNDYRISSNYDFSQLTEEERRKWAEAKKFEPQTPELGVVFEHGTLKLPDPMVVVQQKVSREGKYDVIFTVESLGTMPAMTILITALNILMRKLRRVKDGVLKLRSEVTDLVPTRTIGHAPTAPRVPDHDNMAKEDIDDDLRQLV